MSCSPLLAQADGLDPSAQNRTGGDDWAIGTIRVPAYQEDKLK